MYLFWMPDKTMHINKRCLVNIVTFELIYQVALLDTGLKSKKYNIKTLFLFLPVINLPYSLNSKRRASTQWLSFCHNNKETSSKRDMGNWLKSAFALKLCLTTQCQRKLCQDLWCFTSSRRCCEFFVYGMNNVAYSS